MRCAGTIIGRGSTLGLSMCDYYRIIESCFLQWTSLLIITESPDRIRVTQRWSSTNLPQECSHHYAFLSDDSD